MISRSKLFLLFFIILSLACGLFSLRVGSVNISFHQMVGLWHHHANRSLQLILWDIRIPRIASGFAIGGMLALAGCLMQILVQNPLADPYVLGTSGGACVVALVFMLIGVTGILLNLSALAGAFLSMMFIVAVNRKRFSSTRLLLTGIVMASGWAALTSFILTIAPNNKLPSMIFWLLGDLSNAKAPGVSFSVLLIALIIALLFKKPLDIMQRGQLTAKAQGVNIKQINTLLFFLASTLTAVAVINAGTIGFVGLIVPHLLRLIGITDKKYLFPCCVLLGGSLLTLADSIARIIISPLQLPVGIITALLGVPLFLLLLLKEN